MTSGKEKIVILGTGPCGLGAAWRLQELNYSNVHVFERNSYPGGLASSFQDDKGFTWDIGGHVQFSHYPYFTEVMDKVMGDQWFTHRRATWIWMKERFIPYPFQNNIRHLPQKDIDRCIEGLKVAQKGGTLPTTFKEWITTVFGQGIADLFMIPYNQKVWAYPLKDMSYQWIGERVGVTDLEQVLKSIREEKDDTSWGPNSTFRFPIKGGTGEIWKRVHDSLPKNTSLLEYNLAGIDPKKKVVAFANGDKEPYDILISTIPLDILSSLAGLAVPPQLHHSAVHVFGIGMKGTAPLHLNTKSWIEIPMTLPT